MRRTDSKTAQRGIVLVIVVITIAILSTIVIDFIYSTRVSYEISMNSSNDVQAASYTHLTLPTKRIV